MKDIKGYFWDTNILNYFRREHAILKQHIDRVCWDKIFLPSVVVAESWRGRLRQIDSISKTKLEQVIFSHEKLVETHNVLRQFNVIPFGEEAAEKFLWLKQKVKRQKKRNADMMIAAMTLSYRYILVTRNEQDFTDLLPAQQVENWIDNPVSLPS